MKYETVAKVRLTVIAVLIAAAAFVAVELLMPDKPTKSPAVKETICPVGMHPDRHFEYLIKCADWRKG